MPQSVLVVSGDPRVRADWARQLADQGFRVLRCAGPSLSCALVERRVCPLLTEARFAVYDERCVTPEWTNAIVGDRTGPSVIVAGDRVRSDGRHEPVLRRPDAPPVPLRWALATSPGEGAHACDRISLEVLMPITKESVYKTFHVDAESVDRVIERIKALVHEGNVRRLIVKDKDGRTLIEAPLTVGVVGAVLLPVWAAIAAIAAIVADATIVVEQRDPPS